MKRAGKCKKRIGVVLCFMMLLWNFTGMKVWAAENRDQGIPEKEEITYAPQVQKEELEEVTAYTLEESRDTCEVSVPKTEETEGIAEGDYIILPANEENPGGAALAVTEVQEDAQGNLVWQCEEPEALSNFITSIDISGQGEFLPQQAEAAQPSIQARGIGMSGGNRYSNIGRIDYQFSNTVLNESASLNGSIAIEISAIEYRLKMDVGLRGITVEDFYFAVDNAVKVSADLAVDGDKLNQGGRIQLGCVPFRIGGTGINGDIIFWLTYDVKGNLDVAYTFSNTVGIDYQNGAYEPFAASHSSLAGSAALDFAVGPNMQFVMRFGRSISLMDVTLDSGVAGKAGAYAAGEDQNTAGCCLDAYVYLNIYTGKDSLLGNVLELKKNVIWDDQTSPFHQILQGTF